MTKFLVKNFIKDWENVKSTNVRRAYGRLAGIVGIITNTLISAFKIGMGLIVGSIAVMADGINNLADASSSIITLAGFKLSAKKGDKEHPYGHARYEYITGLVVSIIIIVVGFQLLTSSIDKIFNPKPVQFSYIIIIILIISIAVKIWQALFNIRLGNMIHSATLKATGTDSRNDVIATTTVLIGVFAGHLTGLNIDGYMGILVALFIMYSGIMLVKETASPLLGQAPNPHLIKAIENNVLDFQGVLGVHDLVVHDYGPGNVFASIHIEVDAEEDILKSHDLIDNIENRVGSKLHIDLVAHMDPVDTKDPLVGELNKLVRNLIEPLDDVVNFHDLRIVKGETHTNVIFDVVLTVDNDENKVKLHDYFQSEISKVYPDFYVVLGYDLDYTIGES